MQIVDSYFRNDFDADTAVRYLSTNGHLGESSLE